ncbi:insulinase family protein [Microbacterium sp. QXD-8]|uniref:Insulinase family protein n=1 Tax=Microbacterium psychrotolerans TaxID=3068321 RepID=A0ABU0Z401_9MICO|nr:insulinase family protein [Microbacterium sp. QXD-8]MDQ7878534.1 insulinase family protein [Microbacterium sp. QXD-8]
MISIDAPTQFAAALVFGVGRRDEAPRIAGVAHLVEHVVMSRVRRVGAFTNAMTTDNAIVFFAQGEQSQVCDFLGQIAQALRGLDAVTVEEVEAQRRIIAAELGELDEYPGRGHLLDRFGSRGLGLIDLGSPAHRSHTREMILEFAGTWLHSQNATLTASAPLPKGFDLALPQPTSALGDRDAGDIGQTGWAVSPGLPIGISMVLRSHHRSSLVASVAVLGEALTQVLRTDRKMIYSVTPYVVDIDPSSRLVLFALDPPSDDILGAAVAAMDVVRSLAADGPDPELLRVVLADWQTVVADPQAHVEALVDVAASVLRGYRDPDDMIVPDVRSLTGSDIAETIRTALPTILLTIGEVADPRATLETLSETLGLDPVAQTEGHYARMNRTRMARALLQRDVDLVSPKPFRGLRGHQLILDAERVTYVISGQSMVEARLDEVVLAGVNQTTGAWDLTTANGGGMGIVPRDWRGGKRVTERLTAAIPAHLRYPVAMKSTEPDEADRVVAAAY